ncbi:hypothetical protein NARC_10324 [Candidatus Nitrosocosmicus arcticus]|uniref:Uncharacterized protein n=1 Tax=Candidatus Nitrosocosmicus arcticus TaxID=2035267 RepID=A0A557SZ84_9ARCH|nr:hypothetical protein NARC_10324 [Candidatus Nitrosocosmicus arcticus]
MERFSSTKLDNEWNKILLIRLLIFGYPSNLSMVDTFPLEHDLNDYRYFPISRLSF